jgi:predicted SAM-dependent methyltransferase
LAALRRRRRLLANIGAGGHPVDGFVNLDLFAAPGVVAWDCRRSLPFADGSVRGLRAEHFFEHLDPREEAPQFLAAAWRVLEAGGVIRLIVPDAARFMAAYAAGRRAFDHLAVPDPFPDDLPTRMDVVSHVFHQDHEHHWAYDAESLADRLVRAGFTDITQVAFRESLDPALAVVDNEVHAPYSLYVDARRPGTPPAGPL